MATRGMAKLGALTAAVVIHGALAWAMIPRSGIEIEGGAAAQEVRLGTSFADMAAGTLEAVQPNEVTEPVAPENVTHALAMQRPLSSTAPPEIITAKPTTPGWADRVTPDAADAIPTVTAVTPVPETVSLQKTESATHGAKPEPAPRNTPPEVIEAQENVQPVLTRSLRPHRRSAAFEKKHDKAPPPRKTQKKKPAPKAVRGNAPKDATAGSTGGSAKARAKTSGNATDKARAAGNAAASNYPGLVMRRIAGVPRPRANSRGTAVVAFRIDSGGGLAGASIARSSGSAQLDRAALGMVRRAAPFPPPPAGARRNFSVDIKGR